jgi:predicted dehydrogenase
MRHIGCAIASDGVELSAVVEADAARCMALRAQGLPAVTSLAEVPSTTAGAIIATPTPDHQASAMACLDRGWAVLVEKPLTETLSEAQALCHYADTKGLPLRAGHHRRCHPFVAEARKRMARLGGLVAVQGLWSLRKHDSYYEPEWRRTAGAGPILTNLSHEVDLLRYLAGPITEVSAMTAQAARGLDIEDTVGLTLRFENGVLGTFLMSDAGASPWAFEAATGENPAIAVRGPDPLRFIGTSGAISFPGLEAWHASAGNPADWQHPLTATGPADLAKVDGIAVQLDRFAALVAGGADDVLATGQDAIATMAVLDAVRLAAETGQTQKVVA